MSAIDGFARLVAARWHEVLRGWPAAIGAGAVAWVTATWIDGRLGSTWSECIAQFGSDTCGEQIYWTGFGLLLVWAPVGIVTGLVVGVVRTLWVGSLATLIGLLLAVPFTPLLPNSHGLVSDWWSQSALPYLFFFVPAAGLARGVRWLLDSASVRRHPAERALAEPDGPDRGADSGSRDKNHSPPRRARRG